MDRRDAMLRLLGTGALMIAPANAAAASDTTRKVRQLVDRYAAAWNACDMDAMAKLYADDVHWVNIVGMHWQGKAEVDRAHRIFFDIMFKGVPLKLEEIESVTIIPGGAVVAVVRWSVGAFRTPVGKQTPPSHDRMTLVLVPHGGALLIVHGANIQIDELAQKSDPIKTEQ